MPASQSNVQGVLGEEQPQSYDVSYGGLPWHDVIVFQSGVDHLWLGARVQAKPNRHLGRTSRKENLLERDDGLVSVFQIFSLQPLGF